MPAELFSTLGAGAGAAVLVGTAITLLRFLTDRMDAREKQRYARLLGGKAQEPDQPDQFFTDELRYARTAEVTNGRAAMVGFLAAIVMEALTGRGIVGQVSSVAVVGKKEGPRRLPAQPTVQPTVQPTARAPRRPSST